MVGPNCVLFEEEGFEEFDVGVGQGVVALSGEVTMLYLLYINNIVRVKNALGRGKIFPIFLHSNYF